MRIAYLTQSYPPMVSGASLAAQVLAEGMSGYGRQVLVLTSSEKEEPYIRQQGLLTVHHHRSYLNPFRVGQRYSRNVHRENIKLLHDFRPDIIHVHDPFQLAFTGIKYSQKMRIPIAITTHQLPWFAKAYLHNYPGIGNLIEKGLWEYCNWLLRKFNVVISPTQTIANVIYRQTGITSKVINYGIELNYFYREPKNKQIGNVLRKKYNIPTNVPILLHVGRLDLDKSVELVIQAAARSMRGNDAHLLVIGDGTEKTKLMRLCKKLGVDDRSHFPGYITFRQELADVYRMATVFVTASEIETQGIVLVEAAACGLPIIAVNATCIPEIVKHGFNGFLVPPSDVESMACHLSKLISDQDMAKKMGRAGCSISKNFGKNKTIDEHAYLYIKAVLNLKHHPVSHQKNWRNLRDPFG